MSTLIGDQMPLIAMDPDNLYKEVVVLDTGPARLSHLVPITPDGRDDHTRPPIFVAHATLITPGGPVPVDAPIEVSSLAEAIDQVPAALQLATADVVEHIRELQRQASSRIVVPDMVPPGRMGRS